MLATCSVFPLCMQHGRSCSAPLNTQSNWLPAKKTRTCLLVGSRGMPYHFFPPAFWKRNKALVAVGLHRSSGCRCLCYLPPGDCSPTHTSPEKAQLYKQPLQSRVSTDPGRTAMGLPGVKWEFFKWWALFVLPLLFLQNVSVPYGFPYTKCPETCSSADGWDLRYRCELRDFRAAVGPQTPSGCSSPPMGMVHFRDQEKPFWPHSHYSLRSHPRWLLFPCPNQSLQDMSTDLSINRSPKASRTIELSCPG